ncbi:hypothetical protein MGLY_10560 [Neomoorella glycerini]|uniref:Uncharacterized protein n=1 Tax=Neomoorella glycerini TaxID=55779 RepID=A0A6I5ZP20_9FIRM|nr:hypothetical protein [Moorella glycerini]QGP91714.1 hypothetical protein MGLY_10560 [Moorella glycerini]
MADRIQTFIDGVKLVLEREFPDLTGAYRYPVRARVIKVQGAGADIELLDKDGGPSPPTPPRRPLPGRNGAFAWRSSQGWFLLQRPGPGVYRSQDIGGEQNGRAGGHSGG